MKISDVKVLCKKIMQAGEIPLLWGHFGVGKTDIAKQIAAETNRKLIILIISQMEPGDLIGLPIRDTGIERTVFLKPDWWPENGNVLLFIDEINRAHKSIRNAIMQLLIDRRIHNHVLPEGVWILGSANPPDDEYDQAELITDPAFLSRFFHLEITPSVDDWLKWANENDLDKRVMDFIESFPEFLSKDRKLSTRFEPRPSPRSWFKLSNVLKILSKEEIEKYGYYLAASIVGSEAARVFMDALEGYLNIPSIEDVLFKMGNETKQKLLNLDRPSLNAFVLRLNNYIENLENGEVDPGNLAGALVQLVDILPKDVFFSIIRNLRSLVDDSTRGRFAEEVLEELAAHPKIIDLSSGRIDGWLKQT